jgi:hypothetical protein
MLVICVLLPPTWLLSLPWAGIWRNAPDRFALLQDGTLTLGFLHSAPPDVIGRRLNSLPAPGAFIGSWWDLTRQLFLYSRFWFPPFREEAQCVELHPTWARHAVWVEVPAAGWSASPSTCPVCRCTRYQIPLWPLALPALPALWVLSRDILRTCRTARRRRRGLCLHCGYDLTGNVSGRCPECGTPCPPQPIHAPTPQP